MNPKLKPNMRIVNYEIQIANAESNNEICVVITGRWEGHHQGDYEITERDIQEIMDNYANEGRDLFFDYDHNSLWGSSKSAGWGKSLELKDGKIYAKVDWTPEGQKAVDNNEYRFLSNVLIFNYYDPNNDKMTGTYLHSVALTNVPFQKDLPAIMNKMFPNITNTGGEMEKLLKLLGVKTEEEAITTINSNTELLTNSQTQAARVPDLETKIKEHETTITELNETIVNSEIDMAIAKGELLPKNRETAVLLRNTSPEAYQTFLKNTEKVPADKLPIVNNQTTTPTDEESVCEEFIPGGE
jgi:phage I-like protein